MANKTFKWIGAAVALAIVAVIGFNTVEAKEACGRGGKKVVVVKKPAVKKVCRQKHFVAMVPVCVPVRGPKCLPPPPPPKCHGHHGPGHKGGRCR